MGIRTFTIGFTKTSAEHFFNRLKNSGVRKIIDVRLNNTSQLAGFAKADDLRYFSESIVGATYSHVPELAPTKSMLNEYKKNGGNWQEYERGFVDLMQKRRIEKILKPEMFEDACLLCSEDKPHNCHRRLVVEYLNEEWGDSLEVKHL